MDHSRYSSRQDNPRSSLLYNSSYMNNQERKRVDRIKAMQTFVRIVEASSFSRAAESLNLPRASLTATMQNLEAYLGRKLLQRTTRSVALTSDGAEYYARCLEILAALEAAEAPFRDAAPPRGRLRVELPGALGRNVVMPRLKEFHLAYPGIELVVGLSDRLADLARDGIDCALRVGVLEDSALIGRQVGSMRFVTCASPAYLERRGVPLRVEDLDGHTAVVHFSGRTGRPFDWEFLVDGELLRRTMNGPVAVNDADAYVCAGLQGLGMIQAASYQAEPHLRDGSLVPVLADYPCAAMPVSLVYPEAQMAAPKLRAFTSWIAALFDAHPQLRRERAPQP